MHHDEHNTFLLSCFIQINWAWVPTFLVSYLSFWKFFHAMQADILVASIPLLPFPQKVDY